MFRGFIVEDFVRGLVYLGAMAVIAAGCGIWHLITTWNKKPPEE